MTGKQVPNRIKTAKKNCVMQRFADLNAQRQAEVYALVRKLFLEGKGFKKVKKILLVEGIGISQGALSYWRNHKTTHLRKNTFDLRPSKELSYFMGVMFGDGSATGHAKNHDYCLRLDSIDKEFVEKFCSSISVLLNKKKRYPFCRLKDGMYSTNIRSKDLNQFVKAAKVDFEKAKLFIEVFPVDFIQGLADSEGCPSISAATEFRINVDIAFSTNLLLLEYSANLLRNVFGIHSAVRFDKFVGMQDSVIEGRLITRTKDLFSLKITSFAGSKMFSEKIGFSIIRKKQKLDDAIFIKESFEPKARIVEWKKLYRKDGKQWKKII